MLLVSEKLFLFFIHSDFEFLYFLLLIERGICLSAFKDAPAFGKEFTLLRIVRNTIKSAQLGAPHAIAFILAKIQQLPMALHVLA